MDRFKFGRGHYMEIVRLNRNRRILCLDVGSGARPFPAAHILCDLHMTPVPDRSMKALVTWDKPFVLCDCSRLPFRDKAFDFVTSYYLLEHVDQPGNLYKELRRVAEHGFIQCPSWLNEILYGEKVHRWIVIKRRGRLFVRPIDRKKFKPRFGFIFHRLYCSSKWQILHAILDEAFGLFTIQYTF